MDLFNLVGDIKELPRYWSNLSPIKISDDHAEYVMRQTVDGVERVHRVGFTRDDTGNWQIENF